MNYLFQKIQLVLQKWTDLKQPVRIYFLSIMLAASVGVGLRANWLDDQHRVAPIVTYDEYLFYISTAKNAYEGRGFYPDYNRVMDGIFVPAPMQAFFTWAVFEWCGSTKWAHPKMVQVFLAGLMILLAGGIGRRVGGVSCGQVLAWVVAIYPPFIFWTAFLYAESNFLFGLTLLIYLLLQWVRGPTVFNAVVISICLGIVNLQRVNGLFLGLLLALLAILIVKPRRLAFTSAAVFAVVPFFVLVPWLVRNIVVYQEPVLVNSNSGVNFYHSNHANLDAAKTPTWREMAGPHNDTWMIPEIERQTRFANGKLKVTYHEYSKHYMRAALNYMLGHPLHFVKNYLVKFKNQWTYVHPFSFQSLPLTRSATAVQILHWLLFIGGLLGWIALLRNGPRPEIYLLLLLMVYFALLGGLFLQTFDGRWTLPHRLLFLIAMSYFVSQKPRWLCRRA